MNNNLEKRIKKEFDDMQTDASAILQTLSQDLNTKPRRIIKKSFVLAFAAVIAMISSVAAADALGFFGQRHLAEIIGEEKAAFVSFAEFINADGYTEQSMITDCGMRIGFVATGIRGNMVDLYVMLEDLAGRRLDGRFFLNYSIRPVLESKNTSTLMSFFFSSSPLEIIHIDRETGIVTLHSRIEFSIPIDDWYIAFALHNIYFNMQRVRNHAVIPGLTDLNHQPSVISNAPLEDGLFPFTTYYSGSDLDFFDRIRNNEFYVLMPNQDSVDFGLEVPFSVSGIGIVDGKLHIQTTGPHRPYINPWLPHEGPFERIELYLRRNGRRIEKEAGIGFFMDEYGITLSPLNNTLHQFLRETNRPYYKEYIFDIDIENLEEYALYGNFIVLDVIDIDWPVTLEPYSGQSIVISSEYLPAHSAAYEIIITSVSVIVNSAADDFSHSIGPITIYTEDGRQIRAIFRSSTGFYDELNVMRTNTRYRFDGIYALDLDTVIAVEVFGEIIQIR